MSKEFRQTLVGLLVIGVSLTLGYFFYQITPLHEMGEAPMPLIGEVMVGTTGLGLCVMGVIAILGLARFIGSGGDI